MPPPSVRVVVVTWQGAHLLPSCLESLRAQTVHALEIVVVDNASTDGTQALLAARFPDVRVIRSQRNLGFAGGVALGMEGFPGDYVVLLNNDATFAPDAVEQLLRVAEQPEARDIAAVTAKILLAGPDGAPEHPGRVNSTGNTVRCNGSGADRDWLAAEGTESTDLDVFGFCGGAALLRAKALRQVGGFDPSLFLYYEDTDLSWRMRAAGWGVRYAPEAVAAHRHASSTGVNSPTFRYYNTRNSLIVFTRHAPVAVVLTSVTRQCLGLLRSALRSGPLAPTTRARARALRDWARRLPTTLRERRSLWASARVSRTQVARYLST
ncbi:MAG: glycosyltransferase family 2 protein [Cellulomonadaceae bacterium]|nr:glycosyltransferase family 2 protein [Cellulomonadaceae bacterium]